MRPRYGRYAPFETLPRRNFRSEHTERGQQQPKDDDGLAVTKREASQLDEHAATLRPVRALRNAPQEELPIGTHRTRSATAKRRRRSCGDEARSESTGRACGHATAGTRPSKRSPGGTSDRNTPNAVSNSQKTTTVLR